MLPPEEEIQFILELPLRNFRSFNKGYNFSCPICGEGKSKNKKRGFVLLGGAKYGHNTFVCHNCTPQGISIKNFIKEVSYDIYERYKKAEKEYFIKTLKNKKRITHTKINNNTSVQENKHEIKHFFRLSEKTFLPVKKFPKIVSYLKQRKIPETHFDKLFYVERPGLSFSNMIIFPFYYDEERVYGFQGRSIIDKRFHTFLPNDGFKIYNLFNVDKDEVVYVFESIIDSFVISNSIAMLGASIPEHILKNLPKRVFIFDNDKTGIQKSLEYIKNCERCFVWPKQLEKYKDFNEVVCKTEMSFEDVRKIIKENIKSGFEAEILLKLNLSKMR